MKLDQIAEIIENMAPLTTQDSWDNSGWQVRLGNPEISEILTALEINEDVIEEAVQEGTQLIVCHHPLIFGGIQSVDDKTVTGKYLIRLISHGISVYATHTPFDKCEGGNNDYLAKILQLQEIRNLPGDESGICRMGTLEHAQTAGNIIRLLGEKTGQDVRNYRLAGSVQQEIRRIGICTGAGAEFMDLAAAAGCDLFITGDVKYHTAHHAEELSLMVLDMGHFGSEQLFTENMASLLREAAGNQVKITESQVNLNPFIIVEQGEF